MRVLKFGGTSVCGAAQMRRVARYVAARSHGKRILVVTSAMAGITDRIVEAVGMAVCGDETWRLVARLIEERHVECLHGVVAKEQRMAVLRSLRRSFAELGRGLEELSLTRQASGPLRDRLLAQGEVLAVHLLAAALAKEGRRTRLEPGLSPVRTDSGWGRAQVDQRLTGAWAKRFTVRWRPGVVPVVPGFVGRDVVGRLTTLGRGGSDLSATVLGAALGADAVEIWTDVDGVCSAPPALVDNARPLRRLGYDEAAELAFLGASVLHPHALDPVAGVRIPVMVRNSFNPDGISTIISGDETGDEQVAISTVDPVVVFEARRSGHVSVVKGGPVAELVGQAVMVMAGSVDDLQTVAVRPDDLPRSTELMESAGFVVQPRHDLSLVAVVGRSVAGRPEVAGRTFCELARQAVPVFGMTTGAGRNSLRFLVDRSHTRQVVRALYETLVGTAELNSVPVSA